MSRIFLTVRDVMKLTGKRKTACYEEINAIKDVLNKKRLTISDYCKYYDLDKDEVETKINLKS